MFKKFFKRIYFTSEIKEKKIFKQTFIHKLSILKDFKESKHLSNISPTDGITILQTNMFFRCLEHYTFESNF